MEKREAIESRIQSLLLGIIMAGVVGCFSFLWRLNTEFSALQERDKQKTLDINTIQGTINEMRRDMQDLKNQVIRIEAKQNSKS